MRYSDALIMFLGLIIGCGQAPENTVVRVYDGDSFVMSNGDEIRLIGIDAPEKGQPGADEARAFLKQLIEGRSIRLEGDKDDTDKYHRKLRYAYIGDTFINAEMLKRGYARTLFIMPNWLHKPKLMEEENQARRLKTGIWSQDTLVYITRTGKKYHRAGCKHLTDTSNQLKPEDAKVKGYGPCKRCYPPE